MRFSIEEQIPNLPGAPDIPSVLSDFVIDHYVDSTIVFSNDLVSEIFDNMANDYVGISRGFKNRYYE